MKAWPYYLFVIMACVLFAQPVLACQIAQNADNGVATDENVGQSFTAPCTGNLSEIQVSLAGAGTTGTLKIYDGEIIASAIYTQADVALNTTGWITVTLSTPVAVISGQQYTFVFTAPDAPDYQFQSGDPYNGGRVYILNGWENDFDLKFRVTIGVLPTVTTTAASSVTANSASSGGNVTAAGDGTISARGVCWNTTGTPTTADSKTSDSTGTGEFTSSITGLSASTTYYVRAYATNEFGTSYGSQVTFTTSGSTPGTTVGKDIIWRNRNTGEVRVWYIDGISRSSAASIATVPLVWSIVAVADFNSDGKSDILWRNTQTGSNTVWYMDGITQSSKASLTVVGTEWNIRGAGDFNNDDKPDLVWRSPTLLRNTIWLMDGITRSSNYRQDDVNAAWGIQGVGDMDADGIADILWRNNSNSQFRIWFMQYDSTNGVTKKSAYGMPNVDSAWAIRGVTDFNDDAKNDILWRNTQTGVNRIIFMDGVTEMISQELDTVSPQAGWDIYGIGSFH